MIIKLFEEYNDQQFEEIDYDIFADIYHNDWANFIELTQGERSKLFSLYGKVYPIKNRVDVTITFQDIYLIIDIIKLSDDWFYIGADLRQILPMSNEIAYKCDELTGVINCVNYIVDKTRKEYEGN